MSAQQQLLPVSESLLKAVPPEGISEYSLIAKVNGLEARADHSARVKELVTAGYLKSNFSGLYTITAKGAIALGESPELAARKTCVCGYYPLSLHGPISQQTQNGNPLYTVTCSRCTYNGYATRDYAPGGLR